MRVYVKVSNDLKSVELFEFDNDLLAGPRAFFIKIDRITMPSVLGSKMIFLDSSTDFKQKKFSLFFSHEASFPS